MKEIELMMFLLKKYLINHHQTELIVEYHDKYLKLKTLILNEIDFKDSNDWFSFKAFIELFKIIIKNSKWHKCLKWSSDKLIINSINSKKKIVLEIERW